MIRIDQYAYNSGLRHVNPDLKILFAVTTLIVCVCAPSPLSHALVLTVMLFLTIVKANIPVKYYVRLMVLPLGFLLLSVLGIVVNIAPAMPRNDPGIQLFGHSFFVTGQGLQTAARLVLKSVAGVSCLYSLILTTPLRELTNTLYRFHVPKPLVNLLTLTYRFIFLLTDKAKTKLNSQKCRFGYARTRNCLPSFGMLWGSVFVQSMQSGQAVYQSMCARGYDAGRGMCILPKKTRLGIKHILIIFLFELLVLALYFV